MADQTPIAVLCCDDYIKAGPDDHVLDIVRRMAETGLPSAIVCEDDVPVGFISEHDLVKVLVAALNDEPTVTYAHEVMVSSIYTVHQDEMVAVVAQIIEARGFRRVPVVDDDHHLKGVVHFPDVVRFHTALLAAQRNELEQRVEDRTRELRVAHDAMLRLAREDGLLGIGNRRSMDEVLGDMHEQALRYHHRYGVALLDVDHFKLYNDIYGHPQADSVLRTIADCLSNCLRRTDRIFRYGGEELLVVLPETTSDKVAMMAERLRAAVEDLRIPHTGTPRGVVTVSVGVCALEEELQIPESPYEVLSLADRALYDAKEAGRNAVRSARLAALAGEMA